jgi:hypothetical protein
MLDKVLTGENVKVNGEIAGTFCAIFRAISLLEK